jgi:hypothetical protein
MDSNWSLSAKMMGGGSYYRAQSLQKGMSSFGEPSSEGMPQMLEPSEDGLARLYTAFIDIGKYKDQVYKSLVEVEEYALVQTILEIMHDDVLSPDEATGECFTINSDNKKYDSIIKGMEARLELEHQIESITRDLLLFGEYPLKVLVQGQEITSLEEIIYPYGVTPVYQGTAITKFLVKTYYGDQTFSGSGSLRPVSAGGFVMFLRSPKSMRAIPSEYFKYISRGTLKVGRSIFPLQTLEKIKALNLTETMIPLARLMQMDKNTVLGVRLGQNMVLKKALGACREYERFLNTRIGGVSTLDINTLVNNIGKYKVIPLLGDKGAVEEMPINPPEIGDLNDIMDIRNSIVSSVGLPPAYVFGDQASNDSLKSYVRYLRKLETIQNCIKIGLKHLATIELYLHGYQDVTPDSINVSFSNLVSIANIERLEFLDILVSLLNNYTTFIGSLKEIEGCADYIDTVAMLQFIQSKLRHFRGAEAPIKIEEKPVESMTSTGKRADELNNILSTIPKTTFKEITSRIDEAVKDLDVVSTVK